MLVQAKGSPGVRAVLFVFVSAKDAMALVVEHTSLHQIVNPGSRFERGIELNERLRP
jgi:hypothetical protein